MTLDRTSLRDALAAAPERAAMLAADADDPPAGEWSAREVLLHLVAVDVEVWQPRLDSLAEASRPGNEPRWAWVEPRAWAGPGDDSLDGALAAFRAQRAATLDRIDGLGAAGWQRFGIHATFGRLDVAGLLYILADHDEEHLAQIADLRA